MGPLSLDLGLGDLGTTTARLYASSGEAAPCLVLAHGAGASQQHPFIVSFASALAERGVDVVTFDFLYMAARRRTPDRPQLLEATWRAVIEQVTRRGLPRQARLVIGGKSMGGRIASQVLASPPALPDVAGLMLLGYPLHPPGQPDRLRVAHLPALMTPTLVVQGTRDEFGSEDEVRAAFASVPARVDWHVVADGDHSFTISRRGSRESDDARRAMYDSVAAWVERASKR